MLRGDDIQGRRVVGLALTLVVGALAALLVALGNPGLMGLCGACFLRDAGGALDMHGGPAIFRPELTGIVLGSLVWAVVAKRGFGRSGSYASARFVLGIFVGIGAMVFLGCPFRMLQRLGGGDLNAWVALPGFVLGVGAARAFERRGYSIGKTSPAPGPVGILGPLAFVALLGMFLLGGVLAGPGPGETANPAHAPWLAALGIALVCGALLSATGFCAVSAARQVFAGPRPMLAGALALVVGYAVVSAATGRLSVSFSGQPVAHGDVVWNAASLALVGLASALAGGCPVRQLVMTGEGNGDAFVTVAGMTVGTALAHNLGIVSAAASADSAGGPTDAGRKAVVVGLAICLVFGRLLTRRDDQAAAPAAR